MPRRWKCATPEGPGSLRAASAWGGCPPVPGTGMQRDFRAGLPCASSLAVLVLWPRGPEHPGACGASPKLPRDARCCAPSRELLQWAAHVLPQSCLEGAWNSAGNQPENQPENQLIQTQAWFWCPLGLNKAGIHGVSWCWCRAERVLGAAGAVLLIFGCMGCSVLTKQ